MHGERSWLSPKVLVGDSPIQGRGLFAAEAIADEAEFRAWVAGRERFDAPAIDEDLNLVLEDGDPAGLGNQFIDRRIEG